MMKMFRKSLRSEAGFTLVELLVVIAVLAILAAVAVPRLTGVKDKAYTTEANHALDAFKTGLEMFNAEHGDYPEDGEWDEQVARAYLTNDQYREGSASDNEGEYIGSDGSWGVTYDNDSDGEDFSVTMTQKISDTMTITVQLMHDDTSGYWTSP
ncbi:MAG: type II secretion system protein [Halanaerobiales bacterium]